ncbi:hypothetical protein NNL21_29700 [Paenibacillus mendelii]|nr:hypothetical protein [Paenibacillus mendelii]
MGANFVRKVKVSSQRTDGRPAADTRISKDDYKRMSDIISAVNQGELPSSALKEAQPLLDKSAHLLEKHVDGQLKVVANQTSDGLS